MAPHAIQLGFGHAPMNFNGVLAKLPFVLMSYP
jgi:hypothetical protein